MTSDIVSLIIFVICIGLFVWDKLPMATTAVIGCVAMVVFNVCDFKTAFGQFSSSTVILTIGVMIIGGAIAETGLSRAIGNWIIKISKGSETKLMIGTYLVSAGMSAFLTNSAVLAIFIPIIIGLSSTGEIKVKNLIMPIALACIIGGASTLVGSTQQMTAQGLLEAEGLRLFKTFDFSLIGVILLAIGLLYCVFIGRKRGMKIWGNRLNEDIDFDIPEITENSSKVKMYIMAGIFSVSVLFYITEWVPLAVTSTACAVLCIVTGSITQKKAFSSVNWNIVIRLAGCLGLAKALEVSGGTNLIADGFKWLVGDKMSPYLIFCLLVLLVQLLSEFISNSTAILIVLPIVLVIAPDLGLNSYAFALGITLASGVSCSSPLASSTMGMSMCVGYKFNDYFKYSFPLDIIMYLTIIILVPLFYGLTI